MLISAFRTLLAGSIDHEDWNANFSEPSDVPDTTATSLEVLNGKLDSTNLAIDQKVTNEMIRPQSMCGGQMVGQTANMDIPDLVFGTEANLHGSYKAIPGACTDFYLPYNCSVVIVQWYFSQTNTVKNDELSGVTDSGQTAQIRCFIDDKKQTGLAREFPGGSDNSNVHQNTLDRCYSLHSIKRIGAGGFSAPFPSCRKGWHTASLRVFMNQNFLRLRVRNVKVIWFR